MMLFLSLIILEKLVFLWPYYVAHKEFLRKGTIVDTERECCVGCVLWAIGAFLCKCQAEFYGKVLAVYREKGVS